MTEYGKPHSVTTAAVAAYFTENIAISVPCYEYVDSFSSGKEIKFRKNKPRRASRSPTAIQIQDLLTELMHIHPDRLRGIEAQLITTQTGAIVLHVALLKNKQGQVHFWIEGNNKGKTPILVDIAGT